MYISEYSSRYNNWSIKAKRKPDTSLQECGHAHMDIYPGREQILMTWMEDDINHIGQIYVERGTN